MKFCYYTSKKAVNTKSITKIVDDVFENTVIYNQDNSVLIVQDQNLERFFYKESDKYGYLCGYIRQFSLSKKADLCEHNESLFSELFANNWPLDNDFTGSFSAMAIDKSQIIIANDLIGIYPIYYYKNDYELIICSSLIALGAIINEKYDYIGVIQRITGPDYCNFGKRTIIKNVSRLLPGEFLKFSLSSLRL